MEDTEEIKFLCLHGWRTSGDIMMIQSYALKDFLKINCVYIDAPYTANVLFPIFKQIHKRLTI